MFQECNCGSRDGAVVRALASHRCAPGSIPGPGVTCKLSLFLVQFSTLLRGFSPVSPFVLPPQKLALQIPIRTATVERQGTFYMCKKFGSSKFPIFSSPVCLRFY